jgi:hypothetical protein
MKSKIVAAGVKEGMIVTLPYIESEETVIEDYIPAESYLAAVSEELRRSGCQHEISINDIQRPNRPKRLEEWCENNGARVPGKRAVAYHIVEGASDRPVVDSSVISNVKSLHESIRNALGLRDVSK